MERCILGRGCLCPQLHSLCVVHSWLGACVRTCTCVHAGRWAMRALQENGEKSTWLDARPGALGVGSPQQVGRTCTVVALPVLEKKSVQGDPHTHSLVLHQPSGSTNSCNAQGNTSVVAVHTKDIKSEAWPKHRDALFRFRRCCTYGTCLRPCLI